MTVPPATKNGFSHFIPLDNLRRKLLLDLIAAGGVHPDAISFDEFASEKISQGKCKIVNASGAIVGDVICVDEMGIIGLAMLRLDDLISTAQMKACLQESTDGATSDAIPDKFGVEIFPFQPEWWPSIDYATGSEA